jgi:2-polyprenyl-3-methyl-5-hydroxy-6-metoxy-1,4-benzoquinol methylase
MFTCEVCDSRVLGIVLQPFELASNYGKCAKCGLLQNLGQILPSKIEGLNFDNFLLAQDEVFEKSRRLTVLFQLEKLLTKNSLELSVFDIGTGSGYFLRDAQQKGFAVSGSELSHSAASIVKKEFGFVIHVMNYEELGFTDCQASVTMFCVLAHSVNPESLLRSIHTSLTDGGVLYFHTPRYCLIDSLGITLTRLSMGRLNHLFLRRIGGDHKRIYSRKSLMKLLKKSGFSEFEMKAEIGYGLKKEKYFTAIGLPKNLSILIALVLNIFSKLKLLPRNVFTVYATKRN